LKICYRFQGAFDRVCHVVARYKHVVKRDIFKNSASIARLIAHCAVMTALQTDLENLFPLSKHIRSRLQRGSAL
jgi:hypothetical protein